MPYTPGHPFRSPASLAAAVLALGAIFAPGQRAAAPAEAHSAHGRTVSIRANGEPDFLADVRCRPAVHDRLAKWQVIGEVFPDAGDLSGTKTWRLPTDHLGVWAVVSVDRGLDPTLARVEAWETRRVTFDKSCTASTEVLRRTPPPSESRLFDDEALAALMKREPAGVICVWSPHMPLSVDACQLVGRVTRDLRVAATLLLDPNANDAYARTTALAAGLPADAIRPFHSVELVFRQATMHAPSILFYKDGRIIGSTVPGYRDEAAYETLIRSRLEER